MDSPASGTPAAEDLAAGNGARDPWPGRSPANRSELDPLAFLKRSAALHPDRTAVVHGALRRTYEELDARVNRLAPALRRRRPRRRRPRAGPPPHPPAAPRAALR